MRIRHGRALLSAASFKTSMTLRALAPLFCLWCGVVSAQDSVELATLVFLGLPEGSTVEVEGTAVELDRDTRLGRVHRRAPGQVGVRVTAPSGTSARVDAELVAGAVTTIQFREGMVGTRFRPFQGAVSLVAPGVPQVRGGRPVVGGAMLVGLVASTGGVVWAGGQMEAARQDASAAEVAYRRARTETDAVAAREAHGRAVADGRAARTQRVAAASIGAAVYLTAVVDAFLNHATATTDTGITASPPRRPLLAVRPAGMGASLTVRL